MNYIKLLLLLILLPATSHAQKIEDLLKELEVARDTTRVIILNQVADAYFKSEVKPKKGQPSNKEKAFEYASLALKNAESIKYKRGMALSYFILGKYYLNKKDYRGAELSFLNSSELAKELREHDLVLKNIDYIFRFHKELGNTNNSIAYADMKSAYKNVIIDELTVGRDKLFKEQLTSLEEISRLDSLLKIEKVKAKEAIAKIKEVEASRIPEPVTIVKYKSKTDYKIAALFFSLLLLMTGSALWFMQLKNRNQRLLDKAEIRIEQLLKKLAELKHGNAERNLISEIGNLNGQEEMNLKIAQLLSQANFIIQKNEILVQLENNYNGLKESKVEELSKKVLALGEVITENYDAEKDWDEFLTHFENVFPDYLNQVKEGNPGLQEIELKVSALQKIDLTMHEMCRILHLPEEEIEKVLVSLGKGESREEVV